MLPIFICNGIIPDVFWSLTPKEVYDTLKVQQERDKRSYREQGALAYISAIMSAEANNGKLKSFETYFPSSYSATDAEINKANRIKRNMLQYASAVNSYNTQRKK